MLKNKARRLFHKSKNSLYQGLIVRIYLLRSVANSGRYATKKKQQFCDSLPSKKNLIAFGYEVTFNTACMCKPLMSRKQKKVYAVKLSVIEVLSHKELKKLKGRLQFSGLKNACNL